LKPLELRDIHLPDAVSWWPPAIGWWMLLLAVILLLLALFLFVKKLKQVSVRKTALNDFKTIKAGYDEHQDKIILSQQLSQLLRQILLSSYTRNDVASVSGEQWLAMLKQSHPKGEMELDWLETITLSSYQKQADYDADRLLSHIECWVNTYPKRYLL